ncbi:NAD-dependent epimerase/dehydratase family protein [Oceanobacillus alkalisoli]|uniref:NAD-dependent epimerase/dehydratase family protein n=1 Tax=Oceanobacillus alkalisoli TaxID=2925113 RepID=UPI001EE46DF8|nr:NAD-dependent epimerase/dehydratase family protein [Oceanobacillus alkalisoli]MCG5102608.1 NAD-dependent epimerase/dehydratase family protein [Oceanobacillus alkalisoli]
MKRILITGKNSYVGNSFEMWLGNYPEEYEIEKISLRDGSWRERDFSKFDVVLHVAGIAHVSKDPKMEELYYRVNRDLTIEVAEKSKVDGVQQFVFMSSIIVYGDGSSDRKVIDENTIPKPSNFYGNSKLQAEQGIKPLERDDFKIAIIRPPMIYGESSKGNYPKLAKAAKSLPVFPDVENERSMLHIDNLSEFIRLIIDNKESGLFFPQNKEFVKTSEMVRLIAEAHGKPIKLVKFFNPLLKVMSGRVEIIDKVFGNLVYDKSMSDYKMDYRIKSFKESIFDTEITSFERNKSL